MNEDTTEQPANPNSALLADLDAKAERKARLAQRIFGEPEHQPLDHDRVVGATSEEDASD